MEIALFTECTVRTSQRPWWSASRHRPLDSGKSLRCMSSLSLCWVGTSHLLFYLWLTVVEVQCAVQRVCYRSDQTILIHTFLILTHISTSWMIFVERFPSWAPQVPRSIPTGFWLQKNLRFSTFPRSTSLTYLGYPRLATWVDCWDPLAVLHDHCLRSNEFLWQRLEPNISDIRYLIGSDLQSYISRDLYTHDSKWCRKMVSSMVVETIPTLQRK